MDGSRIKVLLVDDHQMIVESFSALLQLDDRFDVVGTAFSAEEGAELVKQLRPDVAVFDVDFLGRDSFDVVPQLTRKSSPTGVMFLTGHLSDIFVSQAIRMGARGYLLKEELWHRRLRCDLPGCSVSSALRFCSRSPDLERVTRSPTKCDPTRYLWVSIQQLSILRHLARGESVKQIAALLDRSEKSIDSHKYRSCTGWAPRPRRTGPLRHPRRSDTRLNTDRGSQTVNRRISHRSSNGWAIADPRAENARLDCYAVPFDFPSDTLSVQFALALPPRQHCCIVSMRQSNQLLPAVLCFLLVVASSTRGTAAADEPRENGSAPSPQQADRAGIEFFEKAVRPLLAKHCYECHSDAKKQKKGGLLLDLRAGWQTGGDSGPAIVPGKPDESLLISSVKYDSFEMPPKGKLSDAEIAILEKWVAIGAPDPRDGTISATDDTIDIEAARQFWSFQPPQKHAAPQTQNTDWAKSEIDRFLLAKLEAEKLKPVADADHREWLRRVTFDLTGLPPTVAEIDAFLNDSSEIAKANVIDRLLDSPQFGEHWGRHWLDLARYADSNGGDINLTFYNAWRYRDYVVSSFNKDKPFDSFVREQLAGDLLPSDSVEQAAEQLTATGFLIIGPKMLSERNKEKLHMDVVDEQLDTIGRVFLGLTLGCARCHDHKFDPVPAQDYYAMAGILRSTETVFGIRMNNVNVSGWLEREMPLPRTLPGRSPKRMPTSRKSDAELKKLRDELEERREEHDAEVADLPGIVIDDTQAELVGDWKASVFTNVGDGYIHDDRQDRGRKSVTFRPEIPEDGEYEVRVSYASGGGRAKNVPGRCSLG